MKDKKILVIYGGSSSEREVSLRTGEAVYLSLTKNGFKNVMKLDLDFNNLNEILSYKPDICFIALHGKVGEDGTIQKFLDEHNIIYTGSDEKASRIAFDKLLSKECFIKAGLYTPKYIIKPTIEEVENFIPCVVKPAREGSTVGISIVKHKDQAKEAVELSKLSDDVYFAEEFINGKELTVAVFDGYAMPPIWIKPKSGFYDYESKYTAGKTEYVFNLGIDDYEFKDIQKTAVNAYNSLGCKGVARVDIMYNGTSNLLEVNTVPGMTQTSLLPKACLEAGIDFGSLVVKILESAVGKPFGGV